MNDSVFKSSRINDIMSPNICTRILNLGHCLMTRAQPAARGGGCLIWNTLLQLTLNTPSVDFKHSPSCTGICLKSVVAAWYWLLVFPSLMISIFFLSSLFRSWLFVKTPTYVIYVTLYHCTEDTSNAVLFPFSFYSTNAIESNSGNFASQHM